MISGESPRVKWIALLVVAGYWAFTFAPIWQRALEGYNDFAFFYCGGKNAFSPDLYHAQPCHDAQVGLFGGVTYSRLPFHALAFWPISWLPYQVAYGIFQLLQLGAVIWAVRTVARKEDFLFFSCFSPALLLGMANGQDTGFMFALAVGVWNAIRRGNDTTAGILLSLCLIKPHLFLLVPVVLAVQWRWRIIRAAAAGTGVLLAISFAANGMDWPARFLAAISNPAITISAANVVSLLNLASFLDPNARAFEGIGIAIVMLGVGWVAKRTDDIDKPLALALAMGPLIGHHAYIQDTVLVLAAFGILNAAGENSPVMPMLALTVLPTASLMVLAGWPVSIAYPLLLLAVLATMIVTRVTAPVPILRSETT